MAGKAPLSEQEKQVQENIHEQVSTFCKCMDDILLPDSKLADDTLNLPSGRSNAPQHSGLRLAVGSSHQLPNYPSVPATKPLRRNEVSAKLKDLIGYTLAVKPSHIQHKDAGQGLFVDGEAGVGAVIAFYPGVAYSPAYYRYIPGYPRVDLQNPYLITRYDGTVINAQPWGAGGETREIWDSTSASVPRSDSEGGVTGSDRLWKLLNKPLDGTRLGGIAEVLERRNPLAFAHFANHPAKDVTPNAMVCSYDFQLTEKNMRTYIPNVSFGNGDEVRMRKFGTFWFKSLKSSNIISNVPILKSLVLVATKGISNEEVLLNYRLSNLKNRPSWYSPVDEDEDRRRWS
ncbi:uncharacterized protein [Henckelia pumila]